jgi:hypothetical protein
MAGRCNLDLGIEQPRGVGLRDRTKEHMTEKLKVDDYFRMNLRNGSVGQVNQLGRDPLEGYFYGTFYYGRDTKGERMTASTDLIKFSAVTKITEEQFLAIADRDGWGD